MGDLAAITHVAVRYGGRVVVLPAPARHFHIMAVAEQLGFPPAKPDDQGFALENGIFLTRGAAAKQAIASGQIKALAVPPDLYSEDLW